jgi:hypothetical protein
MYAFLAFLGWWKFGPTDGRFQSFGYSAYTLLPTLFSGEFDFPLDPPSSFFILYLLIYLFMSSIILMNFLLAIIVNAHTVVTLRIQESNSEASVMIDVWDTAVVAIKLRFINKYPLAYQMHRFVKGLQASWPDLRDMPAITAEELYYTAFGTQGEPLFASIEVAERYLSSYVSKLDAMQERRLKFCYQEGHYFGEDGEKPLIRAHLMKENTFDVQKETVDFGSDSAARPEDEEESRERAAVVLAHASQKMTALDQQYDRLDAQIDRMGDNLELFVSKIEAIPTMPFDTELTDEDAGMDFSISARSPSRGGREPVQLEALWDDRI